MEELTKKIEKQLELIASTVVSHTDRFDQVDNRLDRMDERFDQVDNRLDRMDERFDRLDQRADRAEEQLDTLAQTVVSHSDRLDHIEENMATKADIHEITTTLDHLVQLAEKKDQELTVLAFGQQRLDDRVLALEKAGK